MSDKASEMALPPNFNPYTQNFTLLLPNGTEFIADMGQVDWLRQWGIRLAINYGTQIGASVLLLVVLIVLTRREKRKSAIFIMNAMCLVINTIRSIVQCLYLTSNWFNPYSLLSGDFDSVNSSDLAKTVAGNTLNLILYICIMASLSLQVWVVCITTQKFRRFLIMGLTTAVALVAIGFRFAITVISNQQSMKKLSMEQYDHLLTKTTIVTTLAIWTYCCVFTFKLGFALLQRKRLGMTQFGPMQIIFIMGCQTMVIPAIFSALQFYNKVPELGSQTPTIVCIFLPLSAIWAGVIASDTGIGSSGADAHQRLLRDQFGHSVGTNTARSNNGGDKTMDSTIYTNSLKDPESPRRGQQSMEDGAIHVNREWSVEKAEASNTF